MVADPAFAALAPGWAFALHDLSGVPRGVAHVPERPVNRASRGLRLRPTGTEAHAAQPETGRSPAPAMAALATALPALSRGQFPGADSRLATLTHMRRGEPAFDVAPGRREVPCTIRTLTDGPMDALRAEAVALAEAARHGVALEVKEADVFAACANDSEVAARLAAAACAAGLAVEAGLPVRPPEDFGVFDHAAKAAMLIPSAGNGPDLHDPDHDFEDGLIAPGAALLAGAARRVLG